MEDVAQHGFGVLGLVIVVERQSEQGAAIAVQFAALFVERGEPLLHLLTLEPVFKGENVGEVGLRLHRPELLLVLGFGEFLLRAVLHVIQAAFIDPAIDIHARVARRAQPLQHVSRLVRRRIILPPPAPAAVVALEEINAVQARTHHALKFSGI